jgi:hypothetical protein
MIESRSGRLPQPTSKGIAALSIFLCSSAPLQCTKKFSAPLEGNTKCSEHSWIRSRGTHLERQHKKRSQCVVRRAWFLPAILCPRQAANVCRSDSFPRYRTVTFGKTKVWATT